MALVLDSGAFIAFDRGNREVAALVEAARRRKDRFVTSSGCVAQSWRGGGARQALLARLLTGVEELALSPDISRSVGKLCAKVNLADVVDAHLALLARDGDLLITSDIGDLGALLKAVGTKVDLRCC